MSGVPDIEGSLPLSLYCIMALSQISLALLVSVTNWTGVSLSLKSYMLPVMTSRSIPCPSRSATHDLIHVCRAFIEQTGAYVRWQADQTRFPPQGDVSDIYDVYASYIYIKLKLFWTQVMGNYTQLISTLTGAFGKFEQDKSNNIILVLC